MKAGNLRDAATSGGFWLAWLLLATALLIPAPTASFCLAFLAVTGAVFPLALGSRWQRVGALAALVLSLLLVSSLVGPAKKDPYFKQHRATQTHQTK
ncbi:hypothetical protein [Trichlorobacter lovleyi]|uniref:hypothetical protein n=1 Tax=Trichlorobacter lovleyi TaxID=313985 RepID=UPI0023F48BC1|nr:hypothetical protein [Trichlorobacter lovleyi]